jgi:hypothetical protein
MIQLLVSPTANEESAYNPSVPSIQPAPSQVSRSAEESTAKRHPWHRLSNTDSFIHLY